MDLGAFCNIDKYEKHMNAMGIIINRLRGYRYMKFEQPLSEKEIEEHADRVYKETFSLFKPSRVWWNTNAYTLRYARGAARRCRRIAIKSARVYNKYCGRDDVMCVHARLGKCWLDEGGAIIEMQPWYIERVNDGFDDTFCDIYVRVDPDWVAGILAEAEAMENEC